MPRQQFLVEAAPVDADAHRLVPSGTPPRSSGANWSSRLSPLPTLPGLMRYLASACGAVRKLRQQPVAVVVEVADQRHVDAHAVELLADVAAPARAASGVLTVMRTISEPACASSLTWIAVPIASAVSVLVIDCTSTGASPPTVTTRGAPRDLDACARRRGCGAARSTGRRVVRPVNSCSVSSVIQARDVFGIGGG